MIAVKCPHCQAGIRCDDHAGQVVLCPRCKKQVQMPAVTQPAPVPAQSLPPAPPIVKPSSQAGPSRAAGRQSLVPQPKSRVGKGGVGGFFRWLFTGTVQLHSAARDGKLPLVQELLAEGVDVNIKARNGFTPLHFAAQNGHQAIVAFLLTHGAIADAEDRQGRRPLSLAAPAGQIAVMALLLRSGADVNAKDKLGQSPLSGAAWAGKGDAVEMLLTHRADLRTRSKSGTTPLLLAVLGNHKSVVELLLAHGANVNEQNKGGGCTALYFAALKGHGDIVKLLVQKGADVNLKDNEQGLSPIMGAAVCGNQEVYQLLLDHGADHLDRDNFDHSVTEFIMRSNHGHLMGLRRSPGYRGDWQLQPGQKFKTPPDTYLIGKWRGRDVAGEGFLTLRPDTINLAITREGTAIWNGAVGKLDSGHIRIKLPESGKPKYLRVSYLFSTEGEFVEGQFNLADVTDDPNNQAIRWQFHG